MMSLSAGREGVLGVTYAYPPAKFHSDRLAYRWVLHSCYASQC